MSVSVSSSVLSVISNFAEFCTFGQVGPSKNQPRTNSKMKIALIGQSVFASTLYTLLRENGHEVVGIFTIPDTANGREDPLAAIGKEENVPVFKFPRWRLKGEMIPQVFEDYKSVGAELNILPYCSQFIPMEVINYPKHKSICYHPSLLPKHRGASSINWTLISGDRKAGLTVFWPDDGLDTGPILLQSEVDVDENDTVESLYNQFLFPEGVEVLGQAVEMIANGTAPAIVQPTEGASYEAMLNKKELVQIKFDQLTSVSQLHNFIRGCDKVPGAWILLDGSPTKVFGSKLWRGALPKEGSEVKVDGMSRTGIVHADGLLLFANDGNAVCVNKLGLESGKMIPANKYGNMDEGTNLGELTPEEVAMVEEIRKIWKSILSIDIDNDVDFFGAGAQSMDVTRLVEEVRDKFSVNIETSDVYMATTFDDFHKMIVLLSRGGTEKVKLNFDAITLTANNRLLTFPHQLFINNEFIDSSNSAKKLEIINPTDESFICNVECATVVDVDKAVEAADRAFHDSEWSRMNARDRGKLLYKLADLMEQYKEELATIETLDSGAVYTLAIKTHVGMSIDTWRYFAGWCDKIHGKSIPINHARPNKNLTFTKREPIGVCGLITPWNYPLMMVSWKMAACLAAGNTVVLKPPQVCPLAALKLAELIVLAGFPPGVVNILPGTGSVCGQAIADHPKIRKLGFTGSTPIGQQIMKSCAISNVKKVSLELGGKSPLVIFADCDLDKAVRQAMSAVFFNKGENCIAAGRIFVEDSIHQRFVNKIKMETRKMKIGDPMDRATAHGPQNHRAHLEKLIEYCEIGVKEGAKLVYGGFQVKRPGLFFMPTIFTNVQDHMYIAKEESFGPIMIISSFTDMKEVIERANDTEFGLASGVFTKDMGKALTFSDQIHAGTCFINTYNKTDVAAPFGGFKQSGFGKDLGKEALNEYLKTKTITIEY